MGQGVFSAMRRIATVSGFEHAGGTPLHISKAGSNPPPPVWTPTALKGYHRHDGTSGDYRMIIVRVTW